MHVLVISLEATRNKCSLVLLTACASRDMHLTHTLLGVTRIIVVVQRHYLSWK